jgi:hypothetical protein
LRFWSQNVTADVVSLKQINRSFLNRQLLLERSPMSTESAITHLVALQAQDVMPPYVGLWSRLSDLERNDVHNGLLENSLIRATLLRGTVHLTTREDVLRILPKVMPELIKYAHAPTTLEGLLIHISSDDLLDWGRSIFADRDLGAAEIREFARRDWPDLDHVQVTRAVQWMLPLMQVPPRGLWKTNAKPRWALVEEWLGDSLDETYELENLILRYITAYGPIAAGDFQTWSRLTGAKEAINRLRPRLRIFRDGVGRELLDVPEAEWPDEDAPAPVRFLGAFDNLWLSHKDRSRVLDERHRLKIINNGIGRPTILVDGFVGGRYKVTVKKDVATMIIELFRPLTSSERDEVAAEAERLLIFLEDGLTHCVEFADTFL